MANIRGLMKKLQTAILKCGLIVKVNTYQFYSADQKRFINIYVISTPVLQKNKYGEWKEKDYEILRSASAIDIVDCLHDIYKAVSG